MATVKERIAKDGSKSYLVTVSIMKDGKRETVSKTYIPESDTWSKRTLDAKVKQFACDFERDVKEGRVLTKKAKQTERAKVDAMPTLLEFLENKFIPSKERELAKQTIGNYKTLAANLKDDKLGSLKVADIRPIHVNDFLQRLIEKGNCVATVNNRRNQLNTVFEFACELALIDNNPIDKVKPLKMSKQEKAEKAEEVKAMTEEETKRFLAIVDTLILVWRVLFRFLLDSACRMGEARGLKWEDINFTTKTVEIKRQLLRDNTESATKTGKARKIVLSDRTIELLRQLKNKSVVGMYVFCNPETGMPYGKTAIERKISEIGKQIGCSWLHCHSLRHTSASLALAHGASLSGISKKLGHSSVQITAEVYLHGDDIEAEKATLAIASIMN